MEWVMRAHPDARSFHYYAYTLLPVTHNENQLQRILLDMSSFYLDCGIQTSRSRYMRDWYVRAQSAALTQWVKKTQAWLHRQPYTVWNEWLQNFDPHSYPMPASPSCAQPAPKWGTRWGAIWWMLWNILPEKRVAGVTRMDFVHAIMHHLQHHRVVEWNSLRPWNFWVALPNIFPWILHFESPPEKAHATPLPALTDYQDPRILQCFIGYHLYDWLMKPSQPTPSYQDLAKVYILCQDLAMTIDILHASQQPTTQVQSQAQEALFE